MPRSARYPRAKRRERFCQCTQPSPGARRHPAMRTTRPRCQASTFAAAAPVGGRQPDTQRHAPQTTA
eukprot:6250156-Prorocentrum_lima.AAC.1